jgi:hypothetical protein
MAASVSQTEAVLRVEQNEVSLFVKLVEQFAVAWHGGAVPRDRAERQKFAERILEEYLPETERRLTGAFNVEEWFLHRDRCATLIQDAVEVAIRPQ